MRAASDIRQGFLDFFAHQGHTALRSGPLVLPHDPTLMFANAGMVPFKDVFTGKERRDYRRATTSQKCIRISGKHNDLEQVGVTARHHTFFEMLGNFSFGDYFKAEAIEYAWKFVRAELRLPQQRLIVTVFGGEGELGADDEAAALWRNVSGLPAERIVRCGAKDNFWQMGDTGPCGPCSELHYFVGQGEPDLRRFGDEPAADGSGWVELWNLVFMQFERQADGKLQPLPAPSIDTGAGLERLAAVAQGVTSNYDTDLLRPLVEQVAALSGKRYGATQQADDISMRVIADHARTTAFLIAEGVFPDRDGRSYVLRRVMRRAIRHGERLGISEPFLHRCAEQVIERMGEAYPELREHGALITSVTREEEERFRQTLRRGLELLDDNRDWQPGPDGQRQLPGAIAFKLYDTYGFPLDLQQVIGEERGFHIDAAGFDSEMHAARERSAGSKVGTQAVHQAYWRVAQEVLPDLPDGRVEFVGYDHQQDSQPCISRIVALLRDGVAMKRLEAGQAGEVITERTPFYGESGGQVGDSGTIIETSTDRPRGGDAAQFIVDDTQKPVDGLIVHRGRLKLGALQVGQSVALQVDIAKRRATRRHHSATHLLHWALRTVLGPQATQKGSRVGPDRLRFDYSASKPLSAMDWQRIEDLVNEAILANVDIQTTELPIDEAKRQGAIGIFEEKYGATVRMLRIGPWTDSTLLTTIAVERGVEAQSLSQSLAQPPSEPQSLELCGGTHARRSGDLGLFKLLSDSGLAAGVRRIEAVVGLAALEHLRQLESGLEETAALLKTAAPQLRDKVAQLLEQRKKLEQDLERLRRQQLAGGQRDLSAQARDIDGGRVLGAVVELSDAKALRELADQLRDKLAPAVILLGAKGSDGNALLACSVSKELTDRFHAGKLVQQAAALVGGKGGGRPDFAQAGGTDPSRLEDAVRVIDVMSLL